MNNYLVFVKLLHTIIWLAFVVIIFAIPALGYVRQYEVALVMTGIVVLEGVFLWFNKGRCPLSNIAEKFTEDRQPNFDIFLPIWIAKYNKQIFTPIYLLGAIFTWTKWLLE